MKVEQGDNEILSDYLNRFKSEVKIVENLFDKKITDCYAESKKEY